MRQKRKYKSNRPLLIHLFKKQKGKCCYCKRNTILQISGESKHSLNTATIEHIYDNFSLIRFLLGKYEKTKMACYECNNKRGKEIIAKHYEGHDYREQHDGLLISLLKQTIY